MENQKNYIQWIRSKVGHDKIILVFAGVVFSMKRERFCFKDGETATSGDFRAELLNSEKRRRWLQSEK